LLALTGVRQLERSGRNSPANAAISPRQSAITRRRLTWPRVCPSISTLAAATVPRAWAGGGTEVAGGSAHTTGVADGTVGEDGSAMSKSLTGRTPDTGGVGCVAAGVSWPAVVCGCAVATSAPNSPRVAAATGASSACSAAIRMWFPFCARRILKSPARVVTSRYGDAGITVQSQRPNKCDLGHSTKRGDGVQDVWP